MNAEIGFSPRGRTVALQDGWRRLFSYRNGRHGGSWGYCFACGTSWKYVRAHETSYSLSSGCFPLCEFCWAERTPEDRLPFYRQMWDRNQRLGSTQPESTWDLIRELSLHGRYVGGYAPGVRP